MKLFGRERAQPRSPAWQRVSPGRYCCDRIDWEVLLFLVPVFLKNLECRSITSIEGFRPSNSCSRAVNISCERATVLSSTIERRWWQRKTASAESWSFSQTSERLTWVTLGSEFKRPFHSASFSGTGTAPTASPTISARGWVAVAVIQTDWHSSERCSPAAAVRNARCGSIR